MVRKKIKTDKNGDTILTITFYDIQIVLVHQLIICFRKINNKNKKIKKMRRNFFTIFRDFENLMSDELFGDFNATLKDDLNKTIHKYTSNRPLSNVYEDEWSYRYEIFTPGFLKENINVEVKGGEFEVTGTLNNDNDKEKNNCIIKEFNLTKFYRNFVLPENVLLDEIHAKVENGITTIFIPKEKPTKIKDYSRKIEIE